MEKLKRYLGLVVAIALLVLAFIPVGRDNRFPMASQLTPLDSTVLTQLMYRGVDDMALWVRATDYLNSCPPFQKEDRSGRSGYPDGGYCANNPAYNMFTISTRERQGFLTALEPALPALLDEYDSAVSAEAELHRTSAAAYRNRDLLSSPRSAHSARSARSLKVEFRLGTAIAKYLDNARPALVMVVYLAHATLLAAVLLIVLGRQSVGAALLWPFSLLFGAASAGAKAAKGLHDKV